MSVQLKICDVSNRKGISAHTAIADGIALNTPLFVRTLGRVTRDREFEAGFLRLASLLELHSSSSIGQVARQWAEN